MLREKLQARLKELAAALEKFKDNDDLTADDLASIDAMAKESEDIENKLKALDAAEKAVARNGKPARDPVVDGTVSAAAKKDLSTAEKVGLAVTALAKAHVDGEGNGHRAAMRTLEAAGYAAVAQEFDVARRTVNSGNAAGGGVLVPENMANEIIDVLRPKTTFLRGGPTRVPLVNGNYKVTAAASGATAYWRGEGKPAKISSPTFKDINMSSKFLDTLVPMTNQIIRFSLPDVRRWVEMDMANAMGVALDYAAYYGSGSVNQPLGLVNIPGVTTLTATNSATPTVAQIESDCAAAELTMMSVDMPMLGAAWVMAPRTLLFLQNLRDGNGNRYFPELQRDQPMFRNKPVFDTTQVPVTNGVGTDESQILLVAFGHTFYGEGTQITFAVSTEAAYVNNGTTVSAFQNDLTLIKASAEADVDVRFLEAVVVLDAVKWGS